MTDRSTYPVTRLAAALLDMLPLADATHRRVASGDDSTSDTARAAVLGAALAWWQIETEYDVLTPDCVTENLAELRTYIEERVLGIVLEVVVPVDERARRAAAVLVDLHGPGDDTTAAVHGRP